VGCPHPNPPPQGGRGQDAVRVRSRCPAFHPTPLTPLPRGKKGTDSAGQLPDRPLLLVRFDRPGPELPYLPHRLVRVNAGRHEVAGEDGPRPSQAGEAVHRRTQPRPLRPQERVQNGVELPVGRGGQVRDRDVDGEEAGVVDPRAGQGVFGERDQHLDPVRAEPAEVVGRPGPGQPGQVRRVHPTEPRRRHETPGIVYV
jgi:hypothetical protein